jgi:predicted lipoprotein
VAPIVLVAMLRPWSVRPIEGEKPVAFDAARFASSAWPRLVRETAQTAADVSEVAAADGILPPAARVVKGSGVVSAVDRQSRVGVMLVRVPGAQPITVAIQIGPVIRGTALRDAAGFIQFSDFTNQSDYASAANALNDYALRTVVSPLPIDTLQGRTVRFVGAAGKPSPGDDGTVVIVPVHLDVVQDAAK